MKRQLKQALAGSLTLAMVLGASGGALAAQVQGTQAPGVSVTVDGKPVDLKDVNGNPVQPVIIDGTTYLPVRAVSEANGLNVDWDGESQEVKLTTNAQPLVIESVVANCTSEPYGKAINSFTYYVNSTASVLGLTTADFKATHCVYDGLETHAPFDANAVEISFTDKIGRAHV